MAREVAHLVLEVSRLHLVGNLFLFLMLSLFSRHFTGCISARSAMRPPDTAGCGKVEVAGSRSDLPSDLVGHGHLSGAMPLTASFGSEHTLSLTCVLPS